MSHAVFERVCGGGGRAGAVVGRGWGSVGGAAPPGRVPSAIDSGQRPAAGALATPTACEFNPHFEVIARTGTSSRRSCLRY